MSKKSAFQMIHGMDHDELKDFLNHYSRFDPKLKLALHTRYCFTILTKDKLQAYQKVGNGIIKFTLPKSLSSDKDKFVRLIFDDLRGHLLDYTALKFYGESYFVFEGVLQAIINVDNKVISSDLRKIINELISLLEVNITHEIPTDILNKYRYLLALLLSENLHKPYKIFRRILDIFYVTLELLNDEISKGDFLNLCFNGNLLINPRNEIFLLAYYFKQFSKLPNSFDFDFKKGINVHDFIQVEFNDYPLCQSLLVYLNNLEKFTFEENINTFLLKNAILENDVKSIVQYLTTVLMETYEIKFINLILDSDLTSKNVQRILKNTFKNLNKLNLSLNHQIVLLKLLEKINDIDLFQKYLLEYNDFIHFLKIDNKFLNSNFEAFKLLFDTMSTHYLLSYFGPMSQKNINNMFVKLNKGGLDNYVKILVHSINKCNRKGEFNNYVIHNI